MDDNGCLRPAAVSLEVNVCAGVLVADVLTDEVQQVLYELADPVVCSHGDRYILLCRVSASYAEITHEYAVIFALSLEIGIQIRQCSLVETGVIFLDSLALIALLDGLHHFLFLGVAGNIGTVAAGTGSEHHHSHCACKQQSDDL